MFSVRNISPKERTLIKSWYQGKASLRPRTRMMPTWGTYATCVNGVPVVAATLYYQQCKEFVQVDNLIADPSLSKSQRREAISLLLSHLEKQAQSRGYKKLFCMAICLGLAARYEELGFHPTGKCVTFIKELV